MKAFNFAKIDIRRSRAQFLLMPFFGVSAYNFVRSEGDMVQGIMYLLFAAIIIDGALFSYEQKIETGFINLLPGNEIDRSVGRCITALILVAYTLLIDVVIAIILHVRGILDSRYMLEEMIAGVGIGLIFIAFQHAMFYALGKGQSQQIMTIIHMIPGFVFFGVTMMFYVTVEVDGMKWIIKLFAWVKENLMAASVVCLAVGVVLTIISILFSAKIMKKKDFV